MVTIIRSEIDIYKEAYKEMKFRCEIAETFNKRYEEQIKILQEENNAYKILLRKQLGGEEVDWKKNILIK